VITFCLAAALTMTLNTDVEGRRKKKRMFVITRRIKGFPAPLGTRLHHWALVVSKYRIFEHKYISDLNSGR